MKQLKNIQKDKKDISNELTVFLISSGKDPSYPLTKKALENQTVKFNLIEIKDVAPMSAAFQKMLDKCKTKWFIQVDSDMCLYPHAVERMYEEIGKSCENIAFECFQLLDKHLNFKIVGVKIYKHEIVKKYPYDLESMSCEVSQIDLMKKDGYIFHVTEEVLGDHAPVWSDELIFQRYLNLAEKSKKFHYGWLEFLPNSLFRIFQQSPTLQNFYAILGMYTSLINDNPIQIGEKDFRNIRSTFMEKFKSYIEPPTQSTLYMTSRCNHKCKYCTRTINGNSQISDVSVDVVKNLFNTFPSINSVCICGLGEPLLSITFDDVLKYLKEEKQGIFVGLVTNGSLLTKKWEIIQKYKPNYISISLNAANKEQHIEEVGVKTWDDVINGLKLVLNSDIQLYVTYICTRKNWYDVPEYLRMLKELGVKKHSVHLHNLLPHSNDDEWFWDNVLQYDDEKMIEVVKRLPEADIVSRWPVLIKKGEIRRDCAFAWKTVLVDGDQNIGVCNSVEPPKLGNGKITDPGVWHNQYCEDFRWSILGEQKEICKKCFRNYVSGF